MSAIPIYVDSNLVCVMPDGSTEEMARDEIKRLKIIHGVDRVYTIGARNTGRGVMMALDGDAQTIATLRADLARVTTAQTHTGVTADSRETICGLPRAPAFLEVPASDGVTCIACLQGVGRLYGENAFRNLNDAIANRERAERAEADLARVTGELDGLADGLTIANNAAERRGRERDAARAQVRELTAELTESVARVDRQTDWYQQRFNALRQWVENEVRPLSAEVATRYFAICANGSPAPHESADWRETMHAARLERDAARAQVRELQKVARAAVAVRNGTLGAVRGLDRAVDALPPSMLEEPSDG